MSSSHPQQSHPQPQAQRSPRAHEVVAAVYEPVEAEAQAQARAAVEAVHAQAPELEHARAPEEAEPSQALAVAP